MIFVRRILVKIELLASTGLAHSPAPVNMDISEQTVAMVKITTVNFSSKNIIFLQ